jgi:hypothetical protein
MLLADVKAIDLDDHSSVRTAAFFSYKVYVFRESLEKDKTLSVVKILLRR